MGAMLLGHDLSHVIDLLATMLHVAICELMRTGRTGDISLLSSYFFRYSFRMLQAVAECVLGLVWFKFHRNLHRSHKDTTKNPLLGYGDRFAFLGLQEYPAVMQGMTVGILPLRRVH